MPIMRHTSRTTHTSACYGYGAGLVDSTNYTSVADLVKDGYR